MASKFSQPSPTEGPDLHTSFASNAEEFTTALKNVEKGGRIVLSEGVFQGEFLLEKDGVEIVGSGNGKTVLKGLDRKTCLTVRGIGCSVSRIKLILDEGIFNSGIHLQGSMNRVTEVEATGNGICFRVEGNENQLHNLSISNARDGVRIEGCRNTVDQVKLENINHTGLYVSSTSTQNNISNLCGSNMLYGLWGFGSNNDFSNIYFQKGAEEDEGFKGVWLESGSSNNISNLTTTGYSRKKDDWGLLLIRASNPRVQDSGCGPIYVDASNTTLTNVDCGEEIQIGGDAWRIHLIKCRGQKLVKSGIKVTTTECSSTSIAN